MVKLLLDDTEIELNLIEGTVGPSAIDIRTLYKKTGLLTYDPGFMSTASCSSAITFIDGEKGILRYRGHDIVELVDSYNFLTIVYLLLNGNIPDSREYEAFSNEIKQNSKLMVANVISSFPREAHPMSIVIGAFSALAAISDQENFSIIAIAQIPSIVAAIYRHIKGLPLIENDQSLNYVENFFYMTFGNQEKKEILIKALDTIFSLHADHEQNASTSTVRLSASSGANPFACLAAGSATLWGPAHGGANEAVLNMLHSIASTENIPSFIEKVKNKEVRLMGFGHRVYKNHDPRATLLRSICHKTLEACDNHDNEHLLSVALSLEKIALQDEYFLERKLYPNVDFYSGIILQSIGIPINMFTTVFALARTTGWCAQLNEMVHDAEQRIGRPRQVYIGNK